MCAVNGGWVGRGRGSLVNMGRSFLVQHYFLVRHKVESLWGEAGFHTRISVETATTKRRWSRARGLGRRSYTPFRPSIHNFQRNLYRRDEKKDSADHDVPAIMQTTVSIKLHKKHQGLATYQAKGDRPFHRPKNWNPGLEQSVTKFPPTFFLLFSFSFLYHRNPSVTHIRRQEAPYGHLLGLLLCGRCSQNQLVSTIMNTSRQYVTNRRPKCVLWYGQK